MENYIRNRQVGIDEIKNLAQSLEEYADSFRKKGEEGKLKQQEFEDKWNKIRESEEYNFDYKKKEQDEIETEFKYTSMNVNLDYTIKYLSGKEMSEKGYEWLLDHISTPQDINSISMDLEISYYDNPAGREKKEYRCINARIRFINPEIGVDGEVRYNIYTDNCEDENHNLYRIIEDNFKSCPIRYDKTIKNRNIRIQSFSIAVGVVLALVLFIILKMFSGSLPASINSLISNKNIIVFGQWVIGAILGNICVAWYMVMLYKPILPRTKYVGYDSSSRKSIYKDNVDEYVDYSEVRIGKYYDADIRREKINKLYKIGMIAILVELVISVILFLILK